MTRNLSHPISHSLAPRRPCLATSPPPAAGGTPGELRDETAWDPSDQPFDRRVGEGVRDGLSHLVGDGRGTKRLIALDGVWRAVHAWKTLPWLKSSPASNRSRKSARRSPIRRRSPRTSYSFIMAARLRYVLDTNIVPLVVREPGAGASTDEQHRQEMTKGADMMAGTLGQELKQAGPNESKTGRCREVRPRFLWGVRTGTSPLRGQGSVAHAGAVRALPIRGINPLADDHG